MTKPIARTHKPAEADPTDAADSAADPALPYDREALFLEDGPLHPGFMREAVRTLMRCMPLDPAEPPAWGNRRMHSAMLCLSALHPRDEIEIMLGVQALAACHAAAACWRIGMNHHRPHGDSTRHITTAATAARTFDTMLRALERRQAKPLSVPVGRPLSRVWAEQDPTLFMLDWEDRCRQGEDSVLPERPLPPDASREWSEAALAIAEQMAEQDRLEARDEGLDIANTEGILPGGGMIVPQYPTPQQEAYIARRLGLIYRQEREDNLRRGSQAMPKIRQIRTGDLVP
jgi:hypothetical protein